jgi:GntR family transcriptional regulator/MocR family aminotransferase
MRPAALPCSSSWPDPNLLPVEAVKRAYVGAIERTRPSDLQYSTPEVHPELAAALLPRLAKDGLVAEAHQLIVVNSFNQLLTLVLQVAPALVGGPTLGVAVEEPGYHTALQLIERHGHRLLGVETDGEGMLPGSLRAALAQGARLVLVTPRALNPTGASWTADRRAALADVLGEYPGVLILEDDHFAGIAGNPPGALFNDLRLQDRTIHARSFSKSIGPDLRMTAVVSSGRLQAGLRETKLSAGGWTSRLGQRALAAALEDPALDQALERARAAYAERRDAAIEAITARLPGAVIAPAASGLNLWISLPPGCDAQDVIQNAAHLGVLVASGEPFYVRPGRRDAIRLSIGRVDREAARRAGELLSQAVLTLDDVPTSLVV